ncbi:hypothetical protein GCM10017781_41480 [Deinococcus metalli]|uniref:Uncharacterized protein n=1 Tax=Deinococcus metalli TaxID=1141878 RepID=A0ABQ3JT27_9DEIO|nr:hypothetical protein GCM10017781_41480 [Deinococcus metalli]
MLANGSGHWYTLEPGNFSVRECDPYETAHSPVNGLTRTRRVVFGIRDETGHWHEPIGTTCILKDIFGIEDDVVSVETLLLDSAHNAQQEKLLREGSSLEDYACLNGLDPAWFAKSYWRTLQHDDPIRAAIERIVNGKVLDRTTLKYLKKAQQSGKGPHPTVSSEPKPNPLSPAPAQAPFSITLSGMLLNWLRGAYPLLREELPAAHAAYGEHLLGRPGDYGRTQFLPCRLDFVNELRRLTGMELSDAELRRRQGSRSVLTPEQLGAVDRYWPIVVNDLAYGPAGAELIRRSAHQNLLLEDEYEAVLGALRPYILKEQLANAQVDSEGNLTAPDLLPLPVGATALPIHLADVPHSPQMQRAWQLVTPLLKWILPADSSLLGRLCYGELTHGDDLALRTLLGEQPLMSDHAAAFLTKSQKSGVLPPVLRHALRLAIERRRLPERLELGLDSFAYEQGLDPSTFRPHVLPEYIQRWLMRHWDGVTALVGDLPDGLELALHRGRYNETQLRLLTELPDRDSGRLLDEDGRQYLLSTTEWHSGLTRGRVDDCLEAVRLNRYSVRAWLTVQACLRGQEGNRQALAKEQQRLLHASVHEMQRRLIAQLNSQYPAEMRLLQTLTPLHVLQRLPKTFAQYHAGGQSITVALRNQAMAEWNEQIEPVESLGVPF